MSHSARTHYRSLVMEPSHSRCPLSLVTCVLHVSQWFSIRRITSHHLEADVPFQSLTNHSPSPQCTGSEGSKPEVASPLESAPPVSIVTLVAFLVILSPPPHLSGTWHFLSLGTQGFLATFKMSEFIVEILWYFQSNASTSVSGEFQITSQEEPGF